LCNPRAGGRWKELAGILDSEEAQFVRRIVTDSVEDVADALADLGREAKLLCIYGGDGTIQCVLDRLTPAEHHTVHLALLGGGTMNVTSRWCGFGRSPGANFRQIVRAYRTGNILYREVPLLKVQRGRGSFRGFTFGMGPIVRLLDAYERGRKGKAAALRLAARAATSALLKAPNASGDLLAPMTADVSLDGEPLPYREFSALFANVTGQINPGVVPFVDDRTRDSFYTAAYAVTAREFVLSLPFIARGWLPLDAGVLLRPTRLFDRDSKQPSLPPDPRYVNRTASALEIRTSEPLYTIDGEILSGDDELVRVELGPSLRLVVSPTMALRQGLKIAAGAIRSG